jgi:hypothetical protein
VRRHQSTKQLDAPRGAAQHSRRAAVHRIRAHHAPRGAPLSAYSRGRRFAERALDQPDAVRVPAAARRSSGSVWAAAQQAQ